jgi:hypothetical protein
VLIGLQIVDNLLGKVVNVNHQTLKSGSLELLYDVPQQGLSVDRYQRLRHGIGQGLQACAQPSGKYHRLLHVCKGNIFKEE